MNFENGPGWDDVNPLFDGPLPAWGEADGSCPFLGSGRCSPLCPAYYACDASAEASTTVDPSAPSEPQGA